MTQLTLVDVFHPFVRTFEALKGGSWKAMLRAADAKPVEAAFALEEREGEYLVKALIPGARPADVKIDLEQGKLRVRGTTEVRYTDGKLFGYVRQRPVDETFTLPADAAPEAAVAAMRSGVLCISIPRRCVDAQSCAPLQCSEGAKLGPSSNPDSST